MRLHPTLLKPLPWAGAICSGLLLALCFAPWEYPNLVWIALLPLVWAVWSLPAEAPRARAFQLGAVTGTVFYTSAFYWLASLAPLFSSPALTGLPLLLGAYLGLYPALWAFLISRPPAPGSSAAGTSIKNVAFAVRAAGAWVALDWIRGWLLSGFSWNSLGVALHNNLALIQIADLFGALGITFVIVFANLTIALVVRRIFNEASVHALPRLRIELMTLILLLGMCVSYGIRCVFNPPSVETLPLRAVTLQPNIPQTQKFDPSQEDDVFGTIDRLMSVVETIHPRPDIVLWPEATLPRGMFADEESRRFVLRQANRTELPLLLGSLEEVPREGHPDELVHRNSAVLLSDYATNVQSYQKRHLVPFGEYLPFRDIFPNFVRELIPGDIDPGAAPKVLELDKPTIKIGALVCFEDSLQRETRDIVRAGAQVLVNITNDAWFAQTAGSAQHFANAHLRSVEARLPMLRSTNTGVSCSIDAFGRVESHIDPFSEGIDTLSVMVPIQPQLSVYSRFGDLWIIACAFNGIALWPRKRKADLAAAKSGSAV